MIQNMVLGGSGGGGDAEIKTSTATVNSGGDISFSVDGIPTWFLLYAESAARPTSSSVYHLVMVYDEADLTDSGEGYSANCYYISYYGAVGLLDDYPTYYWYEDGIFELTGYNTYYKAPANANYVLYYTT